MKRKIRKYEVIEGYNRSGIPAWVIREVGNSKASGYIASTWSKSQAELKAVQILIAQANLAADDEALRQETQAIIEGQ